jgi:hypothetical protein
MISLTKVVRVSTSAIALSKCCFIAGSAGETVAPAITVRLLANNSVILVAQDCGFCCGCDRGFGGECDISFTRYFSSHSIYLKISVQLTLSPICTVSTRI